MKNKKGVSDMVNTLKKDERYCSITNSLTSSLSEVNEYKNGKKKLKTWNEYLKEQKKEH